MNANRSGRTPEQDFFEPILRHLTALGGAARCQEIIHRVICDTRPRLRPVDFDIVDTGEIRAANTVRWARDKLVKKGLLRNDSPHGVWQSALKGQFHLRFPELLRYKNGKKFPDTEAGSLANDIVACFPRRILQLNDRKIRPGHTLEFLEAVCWLIENEPARVESIKKQVGEMKNLVL